jgi:hypothetical protein
MQGNVHAGVAFRLVQATSKFGQHAGRQATDDNIIRRMRFAC